VEADVDIEQEISSHHKYSKIRELIAEHLFIGESMRECWNRNIYDVEVLRSESDFFGYDVVMARGDIVRHIQLKSMMAGGARRNFNASMELLQKPSACMIVSVLSDKLQLEHFRWFGSGPGEPIPDFSGCRKLRHTKGDATGRKAERPAHRVIPLSRFEKVNSIAGVLEKLFGSL
jgi:hypothetical protein